MLEQDPLDKLRATLNVQFDLANADNDKQQKSVTEANNGSNLLTPEGDTNTNKQEETVEDLVNETLKMQESIRLREQKKIDEIRSFIDQKVDFNIIDELMR